MTFTDAQKKERRDDLIDTIIILLHIVFLENLGTVNAILGEAEDRFVKELYEEKDES